MAFLILQSILMSTRDLIYDRRFTKGSFAGYTVVIGKEQYSAICIKRVHLWSEVEYLNHEVRLWLLRHGPWEQYNNHTFRFARESTAVMFKLLYC
jgi:hypothetical protein